LNSFEFRGPFGEFDEVHQDLFGLIVFKVMSNTTVKIEFVDMFGIVFRKDLEGTSAVKRESGERFVNFFGNNILHGRIDDCFRSDFLIII